MLERRLHDSRDGSYSGSSDYISSTPLSMENRYPNQIHQVDQFLHKKRNENYYNNEADTFSDQLTPQNYESMTRVPCGFYRQVAYGDELQAYVFVDTRALVPTENSMYVILHEPTKWNFRYTPMIRQFRQIEAEDCEWTTRYLLCQDVIFN